ncbi:MAG: (d)CMP kinase [Saprospiraceae bacterium]|nr:(d)CMP kinase [Saprospiraceae bacterium]MCF8250424.1 (d)CMP kinase [Saprospiraceae bacterium]MCF8280656.1 (d)CMP kinase [Bacteroidales bacterium]MCF8312201.1 (d)CMP kinase [Saprospiraceae bacterium]MCF8440542.1 (d)CMP kinase [Saprospiraceae bacterium]
MNKIIIAIDGHSSCGKSTLARALGNALGYTYISTGDMYRAVTLYFIENQVDIHVKTAVLEALKHINLHFVADENGNHIHLNGRDVSEEIRKMHVAELVSPVAVISEVRREMVRQQQDMGKEKGVVMDGRDIGTVVFPNAELKIFLTADVEVRAQRRFDELTAKGQHVNFDEVKNNLAERDRIDSTRADSPLRLADDSVVIDNSSLNHEQQLELALDLVRERVSG